MSAEFTLTTRKVDLLARVGPAQLMHVEYARRATSDLVPRDAGLPGPDYEAVSETSSKPAHRGAGEGTVDGHDDFAENDFAVNLRLLYLRDADPDRFVPEVNFAPLAMLHRGDPVELEQVAAGVVGEILARGGDRIGDFLECVSVLALIASDPRIVEKIIEEAEMAVETVETVAAFYRDTRFGRKLRAEAHEELLAALLVERFGEHPEVAGVAHRLAS